MAERLQCAVTWRVLQRIAAFFSAVASDSGLLSALRRAWQSSALRRRFAAFALRQDAAERSGAYRLLSGLSRRAAGWHGLGACIRGSLLWRAFSAIFACGRESKILGWLFDGGVTGVILTVLSLYVAFDYGLRDVVGIAFLSSVWDELLLLFAVFWLCLKRVDRETPMRPRLGSQDIFIFAFLMVGFFLMNAVSPFYSIAIAGYRAVCQYIVWFFVVTRLMRDDRDLKRMYFLMVALATVIALHGVYQYIVAAPIPEGWTDAAEQGVRTRVYSIFGSPNIMADFMVIFAPMGAGLAYYTENKKMKVAAWFCTFLMCFACLFTMSRGGWVAMAVAVIIFALLVDRKLLGLMFLAAVAACFLPFVASRIGYLFTAEFAESTARGGRAIRWATGLRYLNDSSPVFGFGLGLFGGAVAMNNKVYSYIQYFYMDNYYMKTLVEMGILGFGSFVVMMLGLLGNGSRALYRSKNCAPAGKRSMYPLCAGMFAGLCGVLVHCYFENIFEEPYMLSYFWIIAAMIIYVGFIRNRESAAK